MSTQPTSVVSPSRRPAGAFFFAIANIPAISPTSSTSNSPFFRTRRIAWIIERSVSAASARSPSLLSACVSSLEEAPKNLAAVGLAPTSEDPSDRVADKG